MSDAWKLMAAERALDFVQPGMKLGLGTGSTAAKFVDLLGAKVKAGLDVVCVATSEATQAQAEALGIRMSTLDDLVHLDLTVDGADELDETLQLIKGGGGALLREKIVAAASDRMVVIADASKRVNVLGAFPLPIEVVQFGLGATRNMIEVLTTEVGCSGSIALRRAANGQPFITDSGNYILDCSFGRIDEADALDEALKIIPGVVENGLFLGLADAAVIAGPGGVEVMEAEYGD